MTNSKETQIGAGKDLSASELQELRYLRTTTAIRERSSQLYKHIESGASEFFELHIGNLTQTETLVAEVMLREYPNLDVPYHSRWRHLNVGGVDRIAELRAMTENADVSTSGRAKFDLIILSVLLDAGAGPSWNYTEASTGTRYTRSEGLAVASYYLMRTGKLSADGAQAFQADAEALTALPESVLREAFQVSDANPLAGIEGRVRLLRALGAAVTEAPAFFSNSGRPGGLFDYFFERAADGVLEAPFLLASVLEALAPIWPGRATLAGKNVGDVWQHHAVTGSMLVPFHKLTQWLVYSLVEPLEEAGIRVTQLDELTGLAEYRNGGLLVDTGVLVPRKLEYRTSTHEPGSELIVEWRAMTICLLDQLGVRLQTRFGRTPEQLPLARVLQGGTWQAGREIAAKCRADASPPFSLVSDGTVF